MSDEKPMGQVIQIDEAYPRPFGEMVRGTVEETLNTMLDAEADQLCGAGRYEAQRGFGRTTRAGSYDRTLQTSAGEVNLHRTTAATFRDGDHRALSPTESLGRGIPDRDVSGGDFGAPNRGHHRGPAGARG